MSIDTRCHDCDRSLTYPPLTDGQKASCPRCGALIAEHKPEMLLRTFVFSLSGLLFFIPANFLPIMTFEMLSLASTNTMLQGVSQLWAGGYWWMGFLVLACSVIVPLVELLLLFAITTLIKSRAMPALAKKLLVWQHHLAKWAMLEVYMLGILVAYIKMSDMGNIVIGFGLYCFAGMLLATILAENSFDSEQAFEILEDIDDKAELTGLVRVVKVIK